MKKAVYKLHVDLRRQGILTGLFVAPIEYVKILVEDEIEVYFGEVLGKHSEIYGTLEMSHFILVSDEESVIKVIEDHDLENGLNPFKYTSLHFDSSKINEECVDDWSISHIIDKIIENS